MDVTKNAVLELIHLEPESSSGIIRELIRLTAVAAMLTKLLPEPEVNI